uniref:PKD domain-containing protein n=1 Tax=Algoriphagus marinus TaxID=1925762 RepID=UPI0009F920D8
GGVALSGSSGNFAGGTYTVTPGIGIEPPTLTLENIAPADYIFTLEVRGGGSCDLDFPIDITVNPLPVTDFEVLDVLCFGGTGSINLISGSEAGHTYTLSNGATNNTGIFSGLPAGDYTVTITSALGCSQILDYTINQPAELLINAIDSKDPTCGAANGEIVFDIIGGIKEYEITVNGTELNTSNFDVAISGDTYTIRGLAPDFYSIAVIDANSCPVDAPNLFELVNDDGFAISILPMEDQICEGGTAELTPQLTVPAGASPVLNWYLDNSLTQEITSSTSPAPDGNIYQISGTGTLSISGLPVGTSTYYLVISGDNICDFVTEATVTVVPPIQTNASATPVICFGDPSGTIQVDTPSGGSGVYEFSLDGNTWQTNTLFENLPAGNYTVFVRDDSGLNGCELQIPDLIVDTPSGPIEENQAVTLPVSCGLDNGAVRDVLVTGGWGNYTFEWRKDDPQNGQVLAQGTITGIEDLASGDYFLIITDEKGCIEIFEYTVGIASDPVYELVDPIDNCLGELIEIKPVHIAPDPSLPPSAGTEIRWYKEANQVDLISNGPDSTDPSIVYTIDDTDWLNPVLQIENLPIGIHDFYFYVVCTGQEIKIEVEVFDKPNVVFETDPVSCFGGTDGKIRSISGTTPEYTYSVDGASPISITDLEALNLAAGTYEIQVLTPAGCPQVVSLVVEEPSGLLEIQLVSELDPSCSLENGEIRLSLLGGNPDYTLTMNGIAVTGFDPSVDGTEVIIQNLAGGTYTFELNDSKNCTSATLAVTLDPLEVPEFSAKGDEICAFDPVSGLANTGILRPVVVNLAGSSPAYTWYYENQSGNEVQITDGDQLFGGTAVINGSGELELTGVVASDTPYKFFLEVTGDLVCPIPKIEVDLKVNFTPEVTFEKTDIICFGETTGEIRVQSGGLAGYVYTLNTGETNTNGEFQNLPAGNYTIEISNGTSCIQTVDVEIVQPQELLIAAVDFTDPTCDAINGEIRFEISGGTQAYDIFVNGDALNSSNFSFTEAGGVYTLQNLAPGQFSIRVLDANGCEVESTDLFSLTNNAGIDIISNPVSDEVCEGETAQLTPDLTLPGGVTPVLRWYKDAATTQIINSSPTPDANGIIYQIDAQGVLSISNLQAGDYKYYLRISGPGICTQVTEATVTVVALPAVTIDISNISCFGANDGSIQISSGNDPSYSYTLSNGESNSTGIFVNLTPGIYSLEVATPSGCPQLLNFEILEPADLIINDLDFVNPSCDEDNGQITFEVIGGTGDYSISINGQLLNDSNFNFIENGQEYTVKGLSPGDYSIQVTDENGCSEIETDLFTLVNESGILIGSNPLLEEIMLGEVATLTPDLTIPSGAVFTLSWYFNSTATQIITSDSNPAPDGVIYEIDANDVLTITGLNPGTYTYYYEISGPGICVTITEAIVVVKSPLTADIVSTPVTCFGGSDGSISVENIVGGNPPLSFSLDGITWQSSPVFENLPVGTYTVYITDPSITVGFLTTFPNVLIETTATQIEINTPDLISASCDLPNGAIRNLQVIGGTGSYSFEWRKDDALSGELLSNGTLTGLEDIFPGEYFITITDSNGCSETFSFVIDELPDPVYELVPPIDICIGEEATIRPVFIAPNPPVPTSPTDIMWYKDAGQVGLISNGPDPDDASIIYTIDDTDWINPQLTIANLPIGVHDFYFYVVCTGQEIKVEVTVFDNPDMVFETSPVSCFGGTDGKILSISGDMPEYTYSLDGAAALTLSELEALELAAGNYSLEVLTPAGCNQIIPITIEGPDSELLLSGITQLDPGCGADNGKIQGQITGGWAPYTVNVFKDGLLLNSFSQSVNSFSLNDLGIGQYTIEVIDDKGCTIVSDIIELVDGPTQLLIENEEICEGSPVTLIPRLDPPVSDFTIQWFFDQAGNQPIISSPNPASDGVIYEISATGELTITGLPYSSSPYAFYATATGPDVCPGFVENSLVQVNEVPNVTISITAEQCFGEGGIITVNASGGSGGLQYSLDGVNFQSSNVFNVPQGIYSVTVRSGQGCDLIISDQEVTGPASPIEVEDLIQIDATCGESDGSISFSLIGGFGGYEVDLIRNSTVISTQNTQADGSISFTGLGAGTYSIQVRDAGSCSITFDNLVQVENIPTPILVDDVSICEGEIATLIPTTLVNNGDTQFTWYFDAQATNPIPVGASGDLTYSISPEGHLAVAGLPAKSTPYEYFVLASGTDICSTIPEKAQVKVIEIPNLRVSNPSIVCDPTGTVDLTAYIEGFNPAVYDYNVVSPNGSPMRLDELDSVDLSGDYRVSSAVKGTSCWNQPQRILVIISQSLLEAEFNYLVDFGGGNIFQNEDIPLGEDVYFNDLSRGNAVIWNWDFGDGFTSNEENPVHTYNEVGSFNVKLRVVDDIGCESIYEMVVNVIDDFEVIIPNAFTPKGNKNQYFKPEYRGIASMEFYIFNTWGELIYKATSLEDIGWDGTLNGKDAPNGNYVYRGIFTSRNGIKIEKAGVFILIR